jgi:hypothetical protein
MDGSVCVAASAARGGVEAESCYNRLEKRESLIRKRGWCGNWVVSVRVLQHD